MTVTASIETRRTVAEDALSRIGYGPGLELASFPLGQQKKIERLLGELTTLADIERSTPHAQIELYGERAWLGRFLRLSDIEVVPGSRYTGEKLRGVIWGALPDGPFKRFQDSFVAPGDRIVPHVSVQTIAGRRVVSFDPDFDPKRASVLPCLVHPDRVSETFLASLGIADFSDLRRKPIERLARKSSLEVVTTLKRVWDGAAPLADKHQRILVVGRRDAALDERYGSFPLPDEAKGKLLVVRRPFEEDPGANVKLDRGAMARSLQVQVFDTPGAVLRRIHHLGAGYSREIEVLRDIHARIAQVHGELSDWSMLDRASRMEVRRTLSETVSHSLTELEAAVDFSKQRARDLMASAHIEDARQRDNPPRAQLVLMRAIEKIVDRLERARSKEGFIKIDERAVEGAMIDADHVLLDYGRAIGVAAAKLDQRHYLFEPRIKPREIETQARGVLKSLRLNPESVSSLELQPYRLFGRALAERHEDLRFALERCDRAGAKDVLVTMHIVSKLYRVSREIERMKIRIARDPETTFEGIRNAVADVLQRFDERDPVTGSATSRLFAERRIPALDEPFNVVRNGLRGILEETTDAGRAKFEGTLSSGDENSRKAALRAHLDRFGRGEDFDLVAILKRLPRATLNEHR